MIEAIKKDFYRNTGIRWSFSLKNLFILCYSHQIRYCIWWRMCSSSGNKFARLKLYLYSRKYGLEISPHASLGEGVYLGHPYNITVAGGVKIGNNVNLHKGCTIGRENRGKREGVPILGDCVSVGINSTIVGKISIGDDVMIAPNTYVNFDVPSHSVVIGAPGKIYGKEDATGAYIIHRV